MPDPNRTEVLPWRDYSPVGWWVWMPEGRPLRLSHAEGAEAEVKTDGSLTIYASGHGPILDTYFPPGRWSNVRRLQPADRYEDDDRD